MYVWELGKLLRGTFFGADGAGAFVQVQRRPGLHNNMKALRPAWFPWDHIAYGPETTSTIEVCDELGNEQPDISCNHVAAVWNELDQVDANIPNNVNVSENFLDRPKLVDDSIMEKSNATAIWNDPVVPCSPTQMAFDAEDQCENDAWEEIANAIAGVCADSLCEDLIPCAAELDLQSPHMQCMRTGPSFVQGKPPGPIFAEARPPPPAYAPPPPPPRPGIEVGKSCPAEMTHEAVEKAACKSWNGREVAISQPPPMHAPPPPPSLPARQKASMEAACNVSEELLDDSIGVFASRNGIEVAFCHPPPTQAPPPPPLQQPTAPTGSQKDTATAMRTDDISWRRYMDPESGRWWWWHPSDGHFFEDAGQWQDFIDAAGRRWWWNGADGRWFYEP